MPDDIGSDRSHGWTDELRTALDAAADAALILRARSGAGEVREKARADLVTAVDEASERAIEKRIRSAFPADVFIAEEFSALGSSRGRRWIVDPLDGTVNFVHGHPFACVSIALVDDDGPAVAVVHAPFLGEVYHAVRGGGAFLNGTRIAVSATGNPTATLIATGFPFKAGKGDPVAYFDLVREIVATTHGVRRAGAAALDLAFVACGRLDGYFEIGLAPWDLAAGLLLVTEAGGVVSGWAGDEAPPLTSGRILASNGKIHPWLAEVTGGFVPPL